jgi:hypothetical protein
MYSYPSFDKVCFALLASFSVMVLPNLRWGLVLLWRRWRFLLGLSLLIYFCSYTLAALERAELTSRWPWIVRRLIMMVGKRFNTLCRHMAMSKALGMEWYYFKGDLFVDSQNVNYHVRCRCKHLTHYKCACKTISYCSAYCQRENWRYRKESCYIFVITNCHSSVKWFLTIIVNSIIKKDSCNCYKIINIKNVMYYLYI